MLNQLEFLFGSMSTHDNNKSLLITYNMKQSSFNNLLDKVIVNETLNKLSKFQPVYPHLKQLFPSQFQCLFNKILYLYYEIVGLSKICQKMFQTYTHIRLCDRLYSRIMREKCPKSTFFVILNREAITIKSSSTLT